MSTNRDMSSVLSRIHQRPDNTTPVAFRRHRPASSVGRHNEMVISYDEKRSSLISARGRGISARIHNLSSAPLEHVYEWKKDPDVAQKVAFRTVYGPGMDWVWTGCRSDVDRVWTGYGPGVDRVWTGCMGVVIVNGAK